MKSWTIETRKELSMVIGLLALAALYRIAPHPYNFAPFSALAIFGGITFRSRFVSVLAPLTAMLVSDAIIGFHDQWFSVYASLAIIALASGWLNRSANWGRLIATSLASSLFFFVVTNFDVWLSSGLYPKTLAGLGQSYLMGIPFLQGTLAGDLMFTFAMFGAYSLALKPLASSAHTLRK